MQTRFLAFLCAALVLTTGSADYAANCALRNPTGRFMRCSPRRRITVRLWAKSIHR